MRRAEGPGRPCSAGTATTSEGERAIVHPNEEPVRSAYDAFARRDMPALMEMFSDEITFVVPGRSIQSGTFSGEEEVGRYFSLVGAHTEGSHRVEVLDMLANDSRVIVLVRALGRRDDQVFDMTLVHIWELVDGKLAKMSLLPADQYAFDAFWS
jgi:ketosteroid isomerase-like protein